MDNKIRRSPINGMPIPPTKTPNPQPIAKPVIRPATKPTANPSTRLTQKPIEPPTSRPTITHTAQTSMPRPHLTTPNPKKKNNKIWLFIIAGIVICTITGIVIAIAMIPKKGSDNNNGDETSTSPTIEENTEEQKKTTEETVNKYAEVTIEGYKEVDDNSLSGKAVVVEVQNKSEEIVSLAIDIGAYDNDDNVMETSSLYAEGMEPGQIYSFNTFVYTELSEEQLRTAKFKVYRAHTYNAEGDKVEEVVDSLAPESTSEESAPSEESQSTEETQPTDANSN